MVRLVVTALVASLILGSAAPAASLLSEREARTKAISVLKGDPYGATDAEVAGNIKQTRWVQDGKTRACGSKKIPAWEFHVVVVTGKKEQFSNGIIDGYLALDARSGRLLCTNLPLLD